MIVSDVADHPIELAYRVESAENGIIRLFLTSRVGSSTEMAFCRLELTIAELLDLLEKFPVPELIALFAEVGAAVPLPAPGAEATPRQPRCDHPPAGPGQSIGCLPCALRYHEADLLELVTQDGRELAMCLERTGERGHIVLERRPDHHNVLSWNYWGGTSPISEAGAP